MRSPTTISFTGLNTCLFQAPEDNHCTFWPKIERREDSNNMPDQAVLERRLLETLETAREQLQGIENKQKDCND